MMLSFADELASRVVRLVEDVGRLHMVSAVGFSSEDDDLFRENRKNLSRGPWRYLELEEEEERARGDLLAAWSSEQLVILLPERLPRSLIELVRAFADQRPEVDLGDMTKRERKQDQNLVLLVNGAPDSESIPLDLKKVICWEFVA